ncbi:hypothetical protein RRG08_030718 [Elysia crispata]|uniref:Uncharacterized protein n=1 Tax=Elysia crispata TaxID=231223 RepID=A0AAE1CSY1_9GAST|nr:hypothetical protein RRG08_030718 [Elysia crispata]
MSAHQKVSGQQRRQPDRPDKIQQQLLLTSPDDTYLSPTALPLICPANLSNLKWKRHLVHLAISVWARFNLNIFFLNTSKEELCENITLDNTSSACDSVNTGNHPETLNSTKKHQIGFSLRIAQHSLGLCCNHATAHVESTVLKPGLVVLNLSYLQYLTWSDCLKPILSTVLKPGLMVLNLSYLQYLTWFNHSALWFIHCAKMKTSELASTLKTNTTIVTRHNTCGIKVGLTQSQKVRASTPVSSALQLELDLELSGRINVETGEIDIRKRNTDVPSRGRSQHAKRRADT